VNLAGVIPVLRPSTWVANARASVDREVRKGAVAADQHLWSRPLTGDIAILLATIGRSMPDGAMAALRDAGADPALLDAAAGPPAFNFLSIADLAARGASEADPLDAAVANFRESLANVELSVVSLSPGSDDLVRYDAPFPAQASAVLLRELLDGVGDSLGRPFAVALPHDSRITFVRNDPALLARARDVERSHFENADHPLSPKLWLAVGAALQPL
jgi:hypothetical protein